jgi:hypothetical protein
MARQIPPDGCGQVPHKTTNDKFCKKVFVEVVEEMITQSFKTYIEFSVHVKAEGLAFL